MAAGGHSFWVDQRAADALAPLRVLRAGWRMWRPTYGRVAAISCLHRNSYKDIGHLRNGDLSVRRYLKGPGRPGAFEVCGLGLGEREGDPVDVLVQPAGVGAGVGTEAAVGLLGAALEDVEAVVEALARVGAGHDVAVVGPGGVAEQAAAGQPSQVEPVVITIEGEVAVAEHLVLGLVALAGDPQGRGEQGPGGGGGQEGVDDVAARGHRPTLGIPGVADGPLH